MKDQTIELADELDAAIANGPQIDKYTHAICMPFKSYTATISI